VISNRASCSGEPATALAQKILDAVDIL
jgi:hypothetical protein